MYLFLLVNTSLATCLKYKLYNSDIVLNHYDISCKITSFQRVFFKTIIVHLAVNKC